MLDYRDLAFNNSDVDGITLAQDRYWGLCIVGVTDGGMILVRLDPDHSFDAHFHAADETGAVRFYMPNCALRFDPAAVFDPNKEPPLGTLVVAAGGISLMVKPQRGGPAAMKLTGVPLKQLHVGLCITKWRIESPPTHSKPEVLYSFEYRQGGGVSVVSLSGS